MKHCVITFRSVTPAQRGENALRRAGISVTLGRTPRWMEEQGCGYSLRIPCADMNRSVGLLRTEQIAFRKLYLWHENGAAEELAL